MDGLIKIRNRLSALLGRATGSAGANGNDKPLSTDENTLKLRFYAHDRFTLNGKKVEVGDVHKAAKAAASNGGTVWVWAERELSDADVDVIKKVLDGVNLRLAFSTDEAFSSMPLPKYGDDVRPSNALVLSSKDELQQFAGNETEFYVYLSSLQLHFDLYRSGNEDADTEDAGIFHIVGAVRPNASKFWFLHPRVHDDEYYRPLVESLEKQPLPTVKGGVLAFLISNKRPLNLGERPQFEVVAPEEWTDVPRRWTSHGLMDT
jgi:hypothetical protein